MNDTDNHNLLAPPIPANSPLTRRVLSAGLMALLIGVTFQPVHAKTSCSFTTSAPVIFGAYNVFSAFPNNNGVGSINVNCSDNGMTYAVSLNPGQSNTYSSRVMKSGANSLYYNLYTSVARNVVWGDGTSGSSVISGAMGKTALLSVFGQIPAGQDVSVGTYTDNITVTVAF